MNNHKQTDRKYSHIIQLIWNFKEWTPSEKEVYLKYQPLHNIAQSMKDSKNNEDLNSIYESVNEISNLLEKYLSLFWLWIL